MDRNTDLKIRKPRKTKGTPLYWQRNVVAAAVIGFGGVCWFLYELWPESSKLKQSIKDGKFELSERWKDHFERIRAGKEDVLFERAAAKVAERR